ncbi:tRNA-dihydrouridine synthase [Leuconostoc litchii]|uniref:tRNA-dihydrouridine synthase n=1 Tax=Leuconostoc litchii TaxID=1981069 RepID=A0A6P2CNS3_9LACO|nr:tRNA-dihydrouridine synthase [Leuconostoc litchii]TYC47204.1 tRNA-dihydrouridine synthase [Leuconostoc litchii]GMA69175.1 tRNA-dihydrouridine synthase [Leuconostoc litchii]
MSELKQNTFWDEVVEKVQANHKTTQPFFSMAPMEAVTDTIFRRVVAKASAPDIYYTEFTNASSMVHPKARFSVQGRLAVAKEEEQPVAQIWGSRPNEIAGAIKILSEMGYRAVDINMGCPDGTVIKNSSGSDLIRHPELAEEIIIAAQTGNLPVSVKTRLGFYKPEEFREWLPIVLRHNVAVLTVHLRSRKEMSKAPAHYEFIDEILAMRDEIAPNTLIQINGDIKTRVEGLKLAQEHPGIDGIMIGRGIFENPYAFEEQPNQHTLEESIALLKLQLDLFDEVSEDGTKKHFEALKRYFKIYLRGFAHASSLRQMLMDTHTTAEVREILTRELTKVYAAVADDKHIYRDNAIASADMAASRK